MNVVEVEKFEPYTLRHTCLTRWSAYMDPYKLAYLAGHGVFATTKRYVHPQLDAVRAAMEKARKCKDSAQFRAQSEKWRGKEIDKAESAAIHREERV